MTEQVLTTGTDASLHRICDRCILSPVYDSHMYNVPVIDPDFYGDMFMIQDESCKPPCETIDSGLQHLQQGLSR